MEAAWATSVGIVVTVIVALRWAWGMLNTLWLKPKKLEKVLRAQGLKGNPYRFLVGDLNEMTKVRKESETKTMPLSDDIAPHVEAYLVQSVHKHGNISFIWLGPTPRVTLNDPELIKEVFNNMYDFTKPSNSVIKLLATGVAGSEGAKWHKHRRIVNPAFNLEKIKNLVPVFIISCNDMISKWKGMLSFNGSCEVDAWPALKNMTSDVISRAAFGSSYEEGEKIFELLKEQADLIMETMLKASIPGYRFLPTSSKRRMKEIDQGLKALLKDLIDKREKALKAGEATKNDLLGILLESNHKEIQGYGNIKNVGMTLEDVIEECKLFYIAGQETTAVLLTWTMLALSRYPDWQARARDEVLQVFGNQNPDFEGLGRLKIVTMILYEVLRLYTPTLGLDRLVEKDVKLGELTLPAGVRIWLPIVLVHHDCELWGDDAKEFNPGRFSEGISKATNNRFAYMPFGWGPRICVGQNFTMLETKMAVSMILQNFSFELSPTYAHAPALVFTLQPQHGAHIILRKLEK